MSKSNNTLASILKLKCPQCQQHNLFLNKNIYKYAGFFDMPESCPKCGQDFQMESGFYYGAMYVSYGLTITINVAVFVLLNLLNIFQIGLFLMLDFLLLFITLPYIFKVSRSIWISMIIKYDPQATAKYESKK